MNIKKRNYLFFVITSLMIVVAVVGPSSCGRSDSTQSFSPLPTTLAAQDSPVATGLPGPQIVPFQLDKPLLEGDTRVMGTGPAGVPVRLEDVTFAGRVIATGQIEEDGTLELVLSKPLEARHRVGLTVSLVGTFWTTEDFRSPEFNGDGALQVPQIGFYFDTAMVQEP